MLLTQTTVKHASLANKSARHVTRDTNQTATEFAKVFSCVYNCIAASDNYLHNSLVHFFVTNFGPVRAFGVDEICNFGILHAVLKS